MKKKNFMKGKIMKKSANFKTKTPIKKAKFTCENFEKKNCKIYKSRKKLRVKSWRKSLKISCCEVKNKFANFISHTKL